MTRINTNVSSLNAQKSLSRTSAQLQQTLTRLSTGLRINSGKDDPAGLIASENLRADITSTNKAISNTQRANQIIGTADSALAQVSSLLNDIRGLVEEGANTGAMSGDQVAANQLQIDSSLAAINRISQTTKFQGVPLLDGSLDFITTAASVSSLVDMQVNQANLGAIGQIDVNVEISTAATQATITSASGAAKATATLSFAPEFYYDSAAATTQFVTAKDATLKATSLSPEYQGARVIITDTPGAESVSWVAETKTLTIGIDDGVTIYSDISAALNAAGFELVGANTDVVLGADVLTVPTTGTVADTHLVSQTLKIDALASGIDYNNMEISVVKTNAVAAATPIASYYADSNRLIFQVNDTADTTLAALAAAINSDTALNTLFAATGTTPAGSNAAFSFESVADVRAQTSMLNSGYSVSGVTAATNATATLSFAASARLDMTKSASVVHDEQIVVRAKSLNASYRDVRVTFQDTVGAAGAETATYDAGAKTLVVRYEGGAAKSHVQGVLDAINALDGWEAVQTLGTATDHLENGGQDAGATGSDAIDISSLIAGANYNQMKVEVATEAGLTTPRAVYDDTANKMTITINSAAVTSLDKLATAINALEGFAAGVNFKGAQEVDGGAIDATANTNTGSTGGNLLKADLVMNIGGLQGIDVFKFSQGTAANEVAAAINLVQDSTGVSATQNNGLLSITSAAYGSKAFATVEVLDEGVAGTFKQALSADRANGIDIVAKINGFLATADGNTFGINVSTLDVQMEVAATTIGNFSFAITGGGAMFQMGPEVVSNQQARIGIGSMSTASLRGATGRLYELGSGNSAALTSDAGRAAKITDEVMNKVTFLRGRLGAFQKTTLDTNIKSLSDTVENLTSAESDIRDADFAAESSQLTRAQILVQSGMTVLGIANQQPQQVLTLLRG
jgi:flagellin